MELIHLVILNGILFTNIVIVFTIFYGIKYLEEIKKSIILGVINTLANTNHISFLEILKENDLV